MIRYISTFNILHLKTYWRNKCFLFLWKEIGEEIRSIYLSTFQLFAFFFFETCKKCISSIFTLLLQGSDKKLHSSPDSLLLVFKVYIYQVCEYGCSAILYPCVSHACLVPIEARKQCQDSGAGVTDSDELPCEYWELNVGFSGTAVSNLKLSSEPAFQLILFS